MVQSLVNYNHHLQKLNLLRHIIKTKYSQVLCSPTTLNTALIFNLSLRKPAMAFYIGNENYITTH